MPSPLVPTKSQLARLSRAKRALAGLMLAAAVGVPLLAAAPATAEPRVYVWRDAQGVVRFTPVAPAGR